MTSRHCGPSIDEKVVPRIQNRIDKLAATASFLPQFPNPLLRYPDISWPDSEMFFICRPVRRSVGDCNLRSAKRQADQGPLRSEDLKPESYCNRIMVLARRPPCSGALPV
jgi:hypothetical protein